MMDDYEFDIALFMSAYVEFHTEDPGDGSYIPMTVEEAEKNFLGFVANLQTEAWERGYTQGHSDNANHMFMIGSNPYTLLDTNPETR